MSLESQPSAESNEAQAERAEAKKVVIRKRPKAKIVVKRGDGENPMHGRRPRREKAEKEESLLGEASPAEDEKPVEAPVAIEAGQAASTQENEKAEEPQAEAAPAATEGNGENAPSENNASPDAPEQKQDEQQEGGDKQFQRRDRNRFQNGKFNKNDRKNRQRQRQEESIPEVNLDENPDAPKLAISFLTCLSVEELRKMAAEKGVPEEVILDSRKQDLIREILKIHAQNQGAVMVEGTLEVMNDGYGFLRYAINSYIAGTEDVYVPQGLIKGNGLRTGQTIYGQLRTPRELDKYALYKVITVNGETPQKAKLRVPFDTLTPVFPDEKLHLEYASNKEAPDKMDLSTRVVDLFSPIGKGQRSLIVAPPRTGKTVLMQKIANAITTNHPEVTLIVLLVDERPEEVTDMRRNVKAEVVASTFDEQATRHVQVAEMVIEKAKRLVEQHHDVVILLDSITRLARAYNQTVPASGKILSGGVDSNALHKPKRFFGAARNIENGGSLTIISTALIETGSRMDEVIFEEFKGTGNNEIILDRHMADSRKYPAINLKKSGTRRDDLLLSKDELSRIWLLRNAVGNMDDEEMSTFIIDKMKKSNNNKEFLGSMSAQTVQSAYQTMSSVT